MALFGVGGFRNAGLGMAAIDFEGAVSDADRKTFGAELGLTLLDNQTEATIAAFTDPTVAFGRYQAARKPVLDKAVKEYKTMGKEAVAIGLSKDEAMAYAKKRAEIWS